MEMSSRSMARAAGALYLVAIAAGVFAQGFVSGRLISSDMVTTARNILANGFMYRLGFAAYMVEMVAQLGMIVAFYFLLAPVSRPLAWTSAILGIVGCAIKLMARVFYYAPLVTLTESPGPEQLHTLSTLLKINEQAAAMALLLFGCATVLKGWLLLRATFFPRFLGVLSVLGGLGWLAFIWPPLGSRLFPVIGLVGLVGSVVTIGWLLVVGVDEERWLAQAAASKGSIWA